MLRIVHPIPVAVEIVRHARTLLAVAATERKFGDHLADALDNLAEVSFEDLLGTEANPLLGFRATFGMEHVGGFPEFFQHVEQIENEGDLKILADENLQGALSSGEVHVDLVALRIAAYHFGRHLPNHGSLPFDQ